MTAQTQVPGTAIHSPSQPMRERAAWYIPGPLLLIVDLVLLIVAVILFWQGAVHAGRAEGGPRRRSASCSPSSSSSCCAASPSSPPGGRTSSSSSASTRAPIREPGMQWVNPFSNRIPVSTRIRNMETAQAKVNDADGNPIEIAAVVVWQVQDTAQATYSVDDYVKFVAIQAETAVRHIASSYPYDARGVEGVMSLRDNADEITARLSAELADRVQAAGVEVIETRLTRLSYAAEIAGAMLRQQQASAVVGARAKIVEGAVGMVKMALRAPRRGERRRTRRGAQGRHGLQPARRPLQRTGHPASGEHRLALLLTRPWQNAKASCSGSIRPSMTPSRSGRPTRCDPPTPRSSSCSAGPSGTRAGCRAAPGRCAAPGRPRRQRATATRDRRVARSRPARTRASGNGRLA